MTRFLRAALLVLPLVFTPVMTMAAQTCCDCCSGHTCCDSCCEKGCDDCCCKK
jgi:hypothetical protein